MLSDRRWKLGGVCGLAAVGVWAALAAGLSARAAEERNATKAPTAPQVATIPVAQQRDPSDTDLKADVYDLIEVVQSDEIGPIYYLAPIKLTKGRRSVAERQRESGRTVVVFREERPAASAEEPSDTPQASTASLPGQGPTQTATPTGCGTVWHCGEGQFPPNCPFACEGSCTHGSCSLVCQGSSDGFTCFCACIRIFAE